MEFEEFYRMYPRKVARKDAQKAWATLTREDRELALEALPNHIRVWDAEGRGKEFVPYPASWIRGERWTDEIEMPSIPEKVVAWWATDKGVEGRGRELGIRPRGGESMQEYKARVVEAARKAA